MDNYDSNQPFSFTQIKETDVSHSGMEWDMDDESVSTNFTTTHNDNGLSKEIDMIVSNHMETNNKSSFMNHPFLRFSLAIAVAVDKYGKVSVLETVLQKSKQYSNVKRPAAFQMPVFHVYNILVGSTLSAYIYHTQDSVSSSSDLLWLAPYVKTFRKQLIDGLRMMYRVYPFPELSQSWKNAWSKSGYEEVIQEFSQIANEFNLFKL